MTKTEPSITKIAILSVAILNLSFIVITTAIAITMAIYNSHSLTPIVLAQTQPSNATTNASSSSSTANIDTFRAKGQISSLASDTLAGRASAGNNTSEIWVLGGNWEIGVAKGNLTNFVVNIKMSKIDGKGAHHHSIESLRDATSAGAGQLIALNNGNSTDIKGVANITTNGKLKWKDVPIVVHVLNGNTINFNIEPTKTEDHFKGLPVFGTVESIVDQNGKELLKQ